jgi:hypothetical protein
MASNKTEFWPFWFYRNFFILNKTFIFACKSLLIRGVSLFGLIKATPLNSPLSGGAVFVPLTRGFLCPPLTRGARGVAFWKRDQFSIVVNTNRPSPFLFFLGMSESNPLIMGGYLFRLLIEHKLRGSVCKCFLHTFNTYQFLGALLGSGWDKQLWFLF